MKTVCSLTVVLMKCFLCCISLGQSSAIGSPVLVPFSRWSSEPSLAHCSPDSCPHSSPSTAQSSALSALPHRTPSSFSDRSVPLPLRRSESVGRRNLLRHPNPLPPLVPNRDSDYELEPPDRGRKRAIDNQYMFFWKRQRMKKNKRSHRWKVLQNSRPDEEHPAARRRKELGVVRDCARDSGWRHLCVNDTAGHLTPSPVSCLPCECTIQMFRYQIVVYCRIARWSCWMGTLCDGWSVSRTQTKGRFKHVRVYTGSGHRNNFRPSTLDTFTISCRLEARL